MRAYIIFHHNLMYSSIPPSHYGYVIEKIYSFLLELADLVPLGMEFNGWTLETVARLSPGYIERLKNYMEAKKIEIIGSSYTQAIFPLIPYIANKKNVELGLEVFEEILGMRPKIFLLNEMVYSKGAVKLLKDMGFEAFIFDWMNAVKGNSWPHRVRLWDVVRNEGLKILWADTYMTQKFQRCVWREIDFEDYFRFVERKLEEKPAFIPIYVGDAEVFEYIPGSLRFEKNGEDFKRLKELIHGLLKLGLEFTLPSEILKKEASLDIEIATPDYPVRTKKQPKYNVTRWAVTGRDAARMNAQCYELYHKIKDSDDKDLWKNLCVLWGSDFRTNTTDEKYLFFRNLMGYSLGRAEKLENKQLSNRENKHFDVKLKERGRYLEVETPSHRAVFIKNKGLAVKELVFKEKCQKPLIGTVEHGFYDDISFGADFYSFHTIIATREGFQITDLSAEAKVETFWDRGFFVVSSGCMELPYVSVIKEFRFSDTFEVVYKLYFKDLYPMSVRLGIVTALPDAFDRNSLFYATHNGGSEPEYFELAGRSVKMDSPVNYIVTTSGCLGATEGVFEFGDAQKSVKIYTDKSKSYTVPLVRYEEIGDTFFFRVYHSLCERDEVANVFFKGYTEVKFSFSAPL